MNFCHFFCPFFSLNATAANCYYYNIYVCISIYNIDVRRCVCMREGMCVCVFDFAFILIVYIIYHIISRCCLSFHRSSSSKEWKKIQAIIENNFTKYI